MIRTRALHAAGLSLLACFAILCMGMGGFGDTEIVSKIPEPDRPFTVTVVDATDTTFTVSDFSVEGLTLVPVTLGKAKMSIDFAKVKHARLLHRGDDMKAVISLKDGSTQEVGMSPSTMFYGRTPWGLMQLAAGDVKEIRF